MVIRVVVGLIFAMHGYQKLMGGVDATAGFLGTLGFPIPVLFAVLLIAAELVGGLFLIVGAFTQWSAKILTFVSLVALLTVHIKNGFFMATGGYEFILLLLAACISIVISGAGCWSADAWWKNKNSQV